jgi:hypothetical protein
VRGFFERRGREGFAEGAEKKIPKKFKMKIEDINLNFLQFFCIPFDPFVFFCALRETFAPFAFKKSPYWYSNSLGV